MIVFWWFLKNQVQLYINQHFEILKTHSFGNYGNQIWGGMFLFRSRGWAAWPFCLFSCCTFRWRSGCSVWLSSSWCRTAWNTIFPIRARFRLCRTDGKIGHIAQIGYYGFGIICRDAPWRVSTVRRRHSADNQGEEQHEEQPDERLRQDTASKEGGHWVCQRWTEELRATRAFKAPLVQQLHR